MGGRPMKGLFVVYRKLDVNLLSLKNLEHENMMLSYCILNSSE
jgi:hypothetical protein